MRYRARSRGLRPAGSSPFDRASTMTSYSASSNEVVAARTWVATLGSWEMRSIAAPTIRQALRLPSCAIVSTVPSGSSRISSRAGAPARRMSIRGRACFSR
ncbi:hypothetical protein PV364_30465 [Streptomyces sp. MI02-7b]|nr:hypothetical protein [Streptomyces sp. MI02-7b]MDX3076648.1 hypothetical protein [Streptomyces sp. MI02-7b]